MILRHAILLKMPNGMQQVLTPNTLEDNQIDAALDNLKAQLQAQGIDPQQLDVLTDIEHKKLFYDSKTILQELVLFSG